MINGSLKLLFSVLYTAENTVLSQISALTDLLSLSLPISLQITIETHSNLGSNKRFLLPLLILPSKLAWVSILDWMLLLYQSLDCQDSNTIEGELSFCFILQILLVNPWVWCLMLGSWVSFILGLILVEFSTLISSLCCRPAAHNQVAHFLSIVLSFLLNTCFKLVLFTWVMIFKSNVIEIGSWESKTWGHFKP